MCSLFLHVGEQQHIQQIFHMGLFLQGFHEKRVPFFLRRLGGIVPLPAAQQIVIVGQYPEAMRKWDRRSALSYDAVDVEPASLHEDAADVVLTKMRLETTLKSLDEMPPVYRTALILRVQGYSIKEIAHITNSSAAAVKTRIHRARQLLLQNSQNDP